MHLVHHIVCRCYISLAKQGSRGREKSYYIHSQVELGYTFNIVMKSRYYMYMYMNICIDARNWLMYSRNSLVRPLKGLICSGRNREFACKKGGQRAFWHEGTFRESKPSNQFSSANHPRIWRPVPAPQKRSTASPWANVRHVRVRTILPDLQACGRRVFDMPRLFIHFRVHLKGPDLVGVLWNLRVSP